MAIIDKGASVLAQLKNKSKKSGKSLQLLLQLFCQEEFLRRLFLSKYADNLILKGGLFIYTLTGFESRSTLDVDFLLRNHSGEIDKIREIVQDIISVSTGNDFIEISASDFKTISPNKKYKGVAFQFIGKIKNTRTPFNVDIGIGDVVFPKTTKLAIPLQLDNFQVLQINVYSLESVISEKFDAIIGRLEMTSRMKDFYDIWYISNKFDFKGSELQEAISQTLKNRETKYDENIFEQILLLSSYADLGIKWKQFLKRANLPELLYTAGI